MIVQFGGQTSLNLAEGLQRAGAPIIGTPPSSIDLAEDRDEFQQILNELGLRQPASGAARDPETAARIAEGLGYPVLIRPSYVLGGRAMQLCNNEEDLARYLKPAFAATDRAHPTAGAHPVLIDKFLLDATEIDVDAVADFRQPGRPRGRVRGRRASWSTSSRPASTAATARARIPPHSLSPELVRGDPAADARGWRGAWASAA